MAPMSLPSLNSIPAPIRAFFQHVRRVVTTSSPQSQPNNIMTQQMQKRRSGQIFYIPETYLGVGSDPPVGTVVGITLGVVLGVAFIILLLWWSIYQQSQGFISNTTDTIE